MQRSDESSGLCFTSKLWHYLTLLTQRSTDESSGLCFTSKLWHYLTLITQRSDEPSGLCFFLQTMTITQRSDAIIKILFYLWTLTIFYSIYAALRRTRQGLCCICRFRLYSTILGSKLSCLIELQLAFKASVYLSLHQCSFTRHFPPLS